MVLYVENDYENWKWYSVMSHVYIRKERVVVLTRHKACESA